MRRHPFFMLLLTVIISLVWVNAALADTGVVKVSVLNVRSGPSTGYTIISRVTYGTTVTVLAKTNGWYKIQTSRFTGYVSGLYLAVTSSKPAQPPAGNSGGIGTGTVTVSALNVRSGPGTNNRKIGLVYRSNVLTVTGSVNGWYQVRYGFGTGYVAGSYIRYTPKAAPPPAPPQPPAPPAPPTPPPPPPAPGAPQGIAVQADSDGSWGYKYVTGTTTTVYATTAVALNVRTGPGTSYSRITTLSQGTKVQVLATVNGAGGQWVKFNYNGRTAYMAKWYTTASQVVSGGNPISGVNYIGLEKRSNGDFALVVKSSSPVTGTLDKSVSGTVKINLAGTNLNGVSRDMAAYGFGLLTITGGKVELKYSGWTEIGSLARPNANSLEVVFRPVLQNIVVSTGVNQDTVTIQTTGYVAYSHSYNQSTKEIVLNTVIPVDKSSELTLPEGLKFIKGVTKTGNGGLKISLVSGAFYKVSQKGTAITVTVSEAGIMGKTIVIDPGHGGNDPGAIGPSGVQEADVNLATALKLKALLEGLGAKVVMTRATDTPVLPGADTKAELQARVDVALDNDADVFLSIHHNASANSSAVGTSVWYDTTENGSVQQSGILASKVYSNLLASLKTSSWGAGIYTERFYVTRNQQVAAALAEIQFISNPTQEKLINTPDFQTKSAQGLANGLVAFFDSFN